MYYSSAQQIDFIRNLNISHFTFSKHLKNSTIYLKKYLFTTELVLNAKVKNIFILELALKLEKDRKIFNKNKLLNSLSRSILMCLNNSLVSSLTTTSMVKLNSKKIRYLVKNSQSWSEKV